MHQVFLNAFDEELTSVTLEDPTRILDVGTGTGEWAIGMAEKFPECEVIGLDISAIQPTAVPYNVFFEIDDCTVCFHPLFQTLLAIATSQSIIF